MSRNRSRFPSALRREASIAVALALAVVVVLALGWWMIADRPSPLSGTDPQSRALRDYIAAARRGDCAAVIAALSQRSRELAEAAVAGRAVLERAFCDYSPAAAKLSEFETDRIQREDVSGSAAHVSASYTYDRFFGFYGRGRRRFTYSLVLEHGEWRIDLREHLDQNSRTNSNRRAMFLVQQAWMAIRGHLREAGVLTGDPDTIRAELPGYRFPEIRVGVADSAAPVETLFVTVGQSMACVSLRSETGTLVMVKIPADGSRESYEYGAAIPAVCDQQPLPRPYYGASSGIK